MIEQELVEIQLTATKTLENLRSVAEKHPDTVMGTEEFNALLKRARLCLGGSPGIASLHEIGAPVAGLLDLMGKFAVIEAAAETEIARRRYEAAKAARPNQRWATRSPYLDRS